MTHLIVVDFGLCRYSQFCCNATVTVVWDLAVYTYNHITTTRTTTTTTVVVVVVVIISPSSSSFPRQYHSNRVPYSYVFQPLPMLYDHKWWYSWTVHCQLHDMDVNAIYMHIYIRAFCKWPPPMTVVPWPFRVAVGRTAIAAFRIWPAWGSPVFIVIHWS